MIRRSYTGDEDHCGLVRRFAGKHNLEKYGRIVRHLKNCKTCSPDFFIQRHWETESRSHRFCYGSSETTIKFVLQIYQISSPEIQKKIHNKTRWFIIHANKWNYKIKYSKHLTSAETIRAIIHACQVPIQYNQPRMPWPVSSSTAKYFKVDQSGKLVAKNSKITPQEKQNDELFRGAAMLGSDFILKYAGDATALREAIEISKVLHA